MLEPHVLVFDFDGTLIDSDPLKWDAFFSVAKDYGLDEKATFAALSQGGDRLAIFSRLAAQANIGEKSEQMVKSYTDHLERKFLDLPHAPGMPQAILRLRENGKKVYLNSYLLVPALIWS